MDAPYLYLGSFNSEQFWRDAQSTQLPTISDRQADAIVGVMDEMGFVFCNDPNDVLITRLPMASAHQEYLWELGFTFSNNEVPLIETGTDQGSGKDESICQLVLETANQGYFQALLSPVAGFSPYSVMPATDSFCRSYQLENMGPDIDVVKKVNSKLFSHQLAKSLFADTVGEIIYSADELAKKGSCLLQQTPFLIKDEFGVSGKGNILISASQVLKRVVKHLIKQEQAGCQTRFLLEPLLDKEIDFSCQFELDATGTTKVISIQRMQNAGFAFAGIQTAESAFQAALNASAYFEQVEAIATALYQEGYWGPICLDSMLVKEGTIVPVVEINARKSMGLINHHLDRFLAQFSVRGTLLYFSLGLTHQVAFKDLLHRMAEEKILFLKDRPKGILPLSANTLQVNWHANKTTEQKRYKGRLYASVVADGDEETVLLLNKLTIIFAELGMKRFN